MLERDVERFKRLGLRDSLVTGENNGYPVYVSTGSYAAILCRIIFSSSYLFAFDMRVDTSFWFSLSKEGLLAKISGLKEFCSSNDIF